jgi:hypothetical protein
MSLSNQIAIINFQEVTMAKSMNVKTKINNLSRLAALSFVCFMIGFYLISEMVWGYAFLVAGLLLAVADIVLKRKSDKSPPAPHH